MTPAVDIPRKTPQASERPVSAKTAAEFLQMHVRSVTRLAGVGHIPGHPIGYGQRKKWLFYISELDEWLQAADRFKTVGQHLELRVELRRIEWLLQILNDVRLGMWVKLGSPKDLEVAARDAAPEQMLPLVLMDAAGMFQMVLLGDAIT